MACRWLSLELMTVIGGHNVCYSPIKIHAFGDSAIEYRRKGTEVSPKRQWSIAEKPSFSFVKKWSNEVVLIQTSDNQLGIKFV